MFYLERHRNSSRQRIPEWLGLEMLATGDAFQLIAQPGLTILRLVEGVSLPSSIR